MMVQILSALVPKTQNNTIQRDE